MTTIHRTWIGLPTWIFMLAAGCNGSPYGLYLVHNRDAIATSALDPVRRCSTAKGAPRDGEPVPPKDQFTRQEPLPPRPADVAPVDARLEGAQVAEFSILARSDDGIQCINIIGPPEANFVELDDGANDDELDRVEPDMAPCPGHEGGGGVYGSNARYARFQYGASFRERRPTFRMARYTGGFTTALVMGWLRVEAYTFDGRKLETDDVYIYGPLHAACWAPPS